MRGKLRVAGPLAGARGSVPVTVADAGAKKQDDVIQQRSIAIRRALQLFEEPREQPDVIVLNLDQFLQLLRLACRRT